MGYEGVEFFGDPTHPAEELKSILDEYKLKCCGWHTPYERVQDDKLQETIRYNQVLDNKYIIVPWLACKTKADWLEKASFLNKVAEKLASYGMVTGYHNHDHEFKMIDGEKPWDLFFKNTSGNVVMQLDTGNARLGGADIVEILKEYPGRQTTIHIKPFSSAAAKENPHAGFNPLIGDDDTSWSEVLRLCETTGGTKWYIVEYESNAYEPLRAVDLCLKKLTELRGK